ncbi:phosphoadenosine phosphosulfate reductase family protein [Allorhizobium ampelinum]|uniref:phosphoadenosine phosphosulfate reductase domain-containing protein n=1 Tax=Allorhizobium ampelinum TaxID=3025782 RepID=UPI000B4060B9|nr:phosphoadenosine phosphosulfate reductase family protein [Allorhizobium ampelinum]NTA27425.1 phosphoadenosine phosphosulfate reductase family protein [Allorhizobium ampelinum]OVE94482.1 phosphoadenosine phosphosulfate reductase [Allorhizobium ampelinum]
MNKQLDMLVPTGQNAPIRFVIFVSYGNDSIALLQWAYDNNLFGVAVVFTDTGWMADGWLERVEKGEAWVRSMGFTPYRTKSIGFKNLAHEKSGFPTQQFQWCSYRLKILPGIQWLNQFDPDARAICLIGVRREESEERSNFPEWLPNSENHGGRFMLAPFADWNVDQRNELIHKAGFEVLPHRSRECRCINSNRQDMRFFTDADWDAIREVEKEVGKPLYRPHRHMGAKGADQVREWANSEKGKYVAPEPMQDAKDLEDLEEQGDLLGYSCAGVCPK